MANNLDKKNKERNKDSLQGKPKKKQKEIGGPKGLEPTRYVTGRKKVAVLIFRYPELNKPKIKKFVSSLTVTNKNRGYYS